MATHKPTVVQIIESPLAKHGSFEDFMIQLARRCSRAGINLHYIFPSVGSLGVRSLIESEGAHVWTAAGAWNSLATVQKIFATIQRIAPDAVDFHFGGGGAFLGLYLRCRAAGIKVFFHYHGEIRPLRTLQWRDRHFSALRLISFFVDRFIAVSQANAEFLRELNVRKPIDVIYNGIDIEFFRSHATPRGPGTTFRLLSIGSMIERKRVDVLLRAFALLRRKNSDIALTIVGGGPDEARNRALAAELGLNDSVVFTGLLDAYPFDLLSDADLFVSASESESFGLMFTEAMALSLPVVACRVGGIPEVVLDGSTGILVPPGDPEAFADAVQVLIDDPDKRRRMGVAALEHVRQHFALAARVDELVALFATLIGAKTSLHRSSPAATTA